jgi:hypothetical protein
MRAFLLAGLLSALHLSIALAHGAEAPAEMKQFNIHCPALGLAREFDRAYHQCNNGYENGSCKRFVELFRELLPEYDCQRPFDATPDKKFVVPAIWVIGDAEHEDYVRLLSRMKMPEAKALFASKEFQDTLDGALAEQYLPLSQRAAKHLTRRSGKK